MRHTVPVHALPLALLLAAATVAPAAAQTAATPPANEQVVVPQVERREVKPPKFPSKDIELSALVGTYATQNFGASVIGGLRVGYHITEDFFVEAAFAQTKVSDESFRQILPGGVFVNETETLSYYNVSAGYNVLPGEVFIGSKYAKASSIYLIGGVGSTKFVDQRVQTFNVGFGLRVLLWDRFAVRVDVRDHIFPLDLLGRRQDTQNLELTTGIAYYF